MDAFLAARLNKLTAAYDDKLYTSLRKLAKSYIESGLATLDYFIADLDASNDASQCYAPLQNGVKDLELAKRNAPQNFIHPLTATQIETLATFVSQILFGTASSRKVDAREPDDEEAAGQINELLQWNDDQQPSYLLGFLWLWDSFTFNRGVFYDHWQPLLDVQLEEIEYEMPYVQEKDAKGKFLAKPEDWKPTKATRWRKRRVPVGGFTKLNVLSPYDFFCDPTLPLLRFQEGNFAGHRVMIPWQELERRSRLPVTDYEYVLPASVAKLKHKSGAGGIGGPGVNFASRDAGIGPGGKSESRSFYERKRRSGRPGTGMNETDKYDGGIVECYVQTVKLRPSDHGMYEDDTEVERVEILYAGGELLSVNVSPNKHDQFPYSVGEARPNAHYQFSSSWALLIKPIQDYVDYLKNKHMESLARTSGNIFIFDPAYVDAAAFLDPNKSGLFIPLKEAAQGRRIEDVIKQVPVTDTTARFHEEMLMWIGQAENTTGAHPHTQGQTEDPSQTATQFVGVQQMATGRISTMARNLSQMAIVPQTRRIVMNLQQWMPESMQLRITGDLNDSDPTQPVEKFQTVAKSDIQIEFDVIPSDGSLPGMDGAKVAGLTRIVEAASNPAFTPYFDDTVPGNLSGRTALYEMFRATGIPLKRIVVDQQAAMKNLKARNLAQGGQMIPQGTPGSDQVLNGQQPPPRESINFKDLPPELQAQMAQQTGLHPTPAGPATTLPPPVPTPV